MFSQSLFSQSQQLPTQLCPQSQQSRHASSNQQTKISEFFPCKKSKLGSPISQRYQPIETFAIHPTITGPNGETVHLKPVTELPAKYHDVFSFPFFNAVQSRVFNTAVHTDDPMVLCAPTGSGKTVLFELALIKLHMTAERKSTVIQDVKAIYMAPIKALCTERYEDWKTKFEPLGVMCKELTGDSDVDDFYSIKDANLILTTPEKWDSMTRRWKDNKTFIKQVKLFMIDEVHLLNETSRGPTVEAVVSRMKLANNDLNRTSQTKLRIVAVSATMSNVEDIAQWLGTEEKPAAHYIIDDRYRPVKLTKVVLGYPWSPRQGDFKFDYSLNYKLAQVIKTYSNDRPALIFVSTRKGTQQTAILMSQSLNLSLSEQTRIKLRLAVQTVRDQTLKDCLLSGVGFHNAGLEYNERRTVEELFLSGDLLVLVSTSTLAMGVNLPAHLVIIKSTQHYTTNGFEEYSETEILQMIGRAGRPQFDTSATAVIMTKNHLRDKYETLIGGQQMIESSLHKSLIEHLNAEVVLGTIYQVSVALDWLKATFLYVRIMKNPSHYGLKGYQTKESIEEYLQQLCVKNLDLLLNIKVIQMLVGDNDQKIISTESGKLMARYCLSYDTMSNIHNLTGEETQEQLVNFLAGCKEFSDIQLRVSEKKTLNELNKSKDRACIRYPMKGKIKNAAMKISCLIQSELGCLPLAEFSLTQDITKIFRTGCRITKCLVELYMSSDNAECLYNAVLLNKCMSAHLWENSGFIAKQLPGIGVKGAAMLTNAGIHTFSRLLELQPREIEMMCNRHPPFGNSIVDAVKHLPKYELSLDQELKRIQLENAEMKIALRLANIPELFAKTTAKNHCVLFLIYDADNRIVLKQRLFDSTLVKIGLWSKVVLVKRAMRGDELKICLLSLSWIGLDIRSTFTPKYSGPIYSNYRELKQCARSARGINPEVSSTLGQPQPERPGIMIDTCGHKCANKRTCKHPCCKPKPPKRNQHTSSDKQNMNHQVKPGALGLMPPPDPVTSTSLGNSTANYIPHRYSAPPGGTISGKLSQFQRKEPVKYQPNRQFTDNNAQQEREGSHHFTQMHSQSYENPRACKNAVTQEPPDAQTVLCKPSHYQKYKPSNLTIGSFDIMNDDLMADGQMEDYEPFDNEDEDETCSPPLSLQGYSQYDWQNPSGLPYSSQRPNQQVHLSDNVTKAAASCNRIKGPCYDSYTKTPVFAPTSSNNGPIMEQPTLSSNERPPSSIPSIGHQLATQQVCTSQPEQDNSDILDAEDWEEDLLPEVAVNASESEADGDHREDDEDSISYSPLASQQFVSATRLDDNGQCISEGRTNCHSKHLPNHNYLGIPIPSSSSGQFQQVLPVTTDPIKCSNKRNVNMKNLLKSSSIHISPKYQVQQNAALPAQKCNTAIDNDGDSLINLQSKDTRHVQNIPVKPSYSITKSKLKPTRKVSLQSFTGDKCDNDYCPQENATLSSLTLESTVTASTCQQPAWQLKSSRVLMRELMSDSDMSAPMSLSTTDDSNKSIDAPSIHHSDRPEQKSIQKQSYHQQKGLRCDETVLYSSFSTNNNQFTNHEHSYGLTADQEVRYASVGKEERRWNLQSDILDKDLHINPISRPSIFNTNLKRPINTVNKAYVKPMMKPDNFPAEMRDNQSTAPDSSTQEAGIQKTVHQQDGNYHQRLSACKAVDDQQNDSLFDGLNTIMQLSKRRRFNKTM